MTTEQMKRMICIATIPLAFTTGIFAGTWALRAELGGMIGGVILMFTVLKMPVDLVRELQNK